MKSKTQQAGHGPGLNAREWLALILGLFLGLCLIKFGNPVVLDSRVEAPRNLSEFWSFAWPPRWSVRMVAPLMLGAAVLILRRQVGAVISRPFWILPILWLGWQGVASMDTVDAALTRLTVIHFVGTVAFYFLGAVVLGQDRGLRLMLAGLLAGLLLCLVRGVEQKLVEFPAEREFLVQSQAMGWTNLPPELVLDMKRSGAIVSTNGVDVANPVFLKKYENGRIFGTLVYPNALAGAILLLLPAALTLAIQHTRAFRPMTRCGVLALTTFLGLGGLIWSGSKSGWLIALGMAVLWLLQRKGAWRWKGWVIGAAVLLGLGAFAIRYSGYFSAGATSVGARFDYWRAAVQIVREEPWTGSGPGTFQVPYQRLKSPESEMARLTHNDFLEQFCDSGLIGGLAYLLWIAWLLARVGRGAVSGFEALPWAVYLGGLGWFLQGLSEFGLYIPALAWPAFALMGGLMARTGIKSTNPDSTDSVRSQ